MFEEACGDCGEKKKKKRKLISERIIHKISEADSNFHVEKHSTGKV